MNTVKSTGDVDLGFAGKPRKPNELAQALKLLNSSIEPVPGVQADLVRQVEQSRKLQASTLTVIDCVLLQFENTAILGVKTNAESVQVKLLKLFDLQKSLPLLASAGAHIPASLGCKKDYVFAQFVGLDLKALQKIDLELVFEDSTFLKHQTTVNVLSESNIRPTLELYSQGKDALSKLLEQDNNKLSDLRKFTAQLIELEKRFVMPYVGKADEIISGVVEGWLWCPAKPQARYEVQAWCASRLVGYAMADKYREDLKRAKKSDGCLKFEVPLSSVLFDGQTHLIQMKVIGQGALDCTMDFGRSIEFKSTNRQFNAAIPSFLMGYALDQKVAAVMAEKSRGEKQKKALLENTPKISLHLENFEVRQARALIQETIDQAGVNGLLDLKLAETYMLEKNYSKAADLYQKTAKKAKKFVWAHAGFGEALMQLGRKTEALSAFEEAELLAPNYQVITSKTNTLRAELLLEPRSRQPTLDDLSGLIAETKKALLLDTGNYTLSTQLIQLLAKQKGQKLDGPQQEEFFTAEIKELRHSRMVLEVCFEMLK